MRIAKDFRHAGSDEELPFADPSAEKALRWLPVWLGSALLGSASLVLAGLASSLALRSVASLNALASLVALLLSWGVWKRVRGIERRLSKDRLNRPASARPWWANDEIDALYQDIRKLQAQEPNQPGLAHEIEIKVARLRELQKAEAAAMRKTFESSLSLPPGAALSALREARKLLGRDEAPAAANTTAYQQD